MEPLKIITGPDINNRRKFSINRQISRKDWDVGGKGEIHDAESWITREVSSLSEVDSVWVGREVIVSLRDGKSWNYNMKEKIRVIIRKAVSLYPAAPRELTPEALPASSSLN